MKIIILGSKGFIGSNLKKIFEINNDFTVISLNRSEINNNVLKNIIKHCDVIINCIGSANVSYSFNNTEEDYYSNVQVVRTFLELLKEKELNKIKFINLSSAAVYGNPIHLPICETDNTAPLSPYGFHKLISELLLKEYSLNFGLKTMSLRVFSTYGVGQKKLLLWELHERIKSNSCNKIVLFGTGDETRDYIHIKDLANQILLAIKNGEFIGEAVNIANGEEIKITEIVRIYQKYYPRDFEFEFNGEARKGDPLRWQADINKMRDWGYTRKVEINNGIKEYIDWIIKND